MPRFKAIRDDRLEQALEQGRETANSLDDTYEQRIAEELEAIGKRVVSAINWEMPSVQALIAESERGREDLNLVLGRMLTEAFALGVTTGKESLKLVAPVAKADAILLTNWDLLNEQVWQWAEEHFSVSQRGAVLLPGLQATEASRIRQLMAGYVADKHSQRWLIDRLIGETGLYTRNRARLIARTEVTNMYAQGNLAAWTSRGVKEYSWRTKFDERVCKICGPLHEDRFLIGASESPAPPAHVACRCWIVPYHNWAAMVKELEELQKQQAVVAAETAASGPKRYILEPLGNAPKDYRVMSEFSTLFKEPEVDLRQKLSEDLLKAFGDDQSLKDQTFLEIMNKWNETSNDSDVMALLNQLEASEMFEVELSDWQKNNLERVMVNRKKVEDSGDFASKPEAFRKLGSFESLGGNRFNQVPYSLRSAEEAKKLREVAMRTIYENTQETLKSAGFDHLTLYRGVRPDGTYLTGEIADISGNTLESWTFELNVAKSFSGTPGIVIEAHVPVSRIFGFGSQGMGTMYESEVVVIGKQKGMVDAVRILKGTGVNANTIQEF